MSPAAAPLAAPTVAGSAPARGGADRRWDSLDALRGIAAFLVLVFHCAQMSPGFAAPVSPLDPSAWLEPWSWFRFTPLRLLVSSGPPAVVLFFALSGFVLALPFLRERQGPGYPEFAVKRVCRIYPPFAFAVLVSAALYALVRPVPIAGLSEGYDDVLWDQPLTLGYVVRNLMLTGLREDMTLDLVMWSLVHELRISLVFPLLFLLTRRWPAASVAGSLLLGVVCTMALGGKNADGPMTSLIDTGRFVFLFVAGIVVAANVGAIRRAVSRLPRRESALLWTASVVLLMFPGPTVSIYYNFAWGAGAVGLLVLTVGSVRAERVLSVPPLVWLGRVSYSLYLIHVPLLVASVHLAHDLAPLWAIFAGVVVLSLVCADLMYRWVEVPSMRLGRWLAAGLRREPGRAWPAAWSGARRTRR